MNSMQKFAALRKVASMKKAALAVYLVKQANDEYEQDLQQDESKGLLSRGLSSIGSRLASLFGYKKKKKRPSDEELEAMLQEELRY